MTGVQTCALPICPARWMGLDIKAVHSGLIPVSSAKWASCIGDVAAALSATPLCLSSGFASARLTLTPRSSSRPPLKTETSGLLAWREFFERHQKLCNDGLRGDQQIDMPEDPVVERVRGLLLTLIRVQPHVEDIGRPQHDEGLLPDFKLGFHTLLHDQHLQVITAQRSNIAIIGELNEPLARALFFFPGQGGQQIIAVEMNLEGLANSLVALLQLRGNFRLAGNRKDCREPVQMADDLV